jgi:hypothetical protein
MRFLNVSRLERKRYTNTAKWCLQVRSVERRVRWRKDQADRLTLGHCVREVRSLCGKELGGQGWETHKGLNGLRIVV